MKHVLEGSHAAAEAVRLARVKVISAFPITPQTHIVEKLSEFCSNGSMDARFIRVESEHSALAAVIGSQSTGVRSFTATSSQGLALMHELLHWASGARLPIVMVEVNRALAPGWNIWTDQTDSLAQRDTGWIQLYCETGQEVLDTILMAYKLAESVFLPVMVVLDAFFLSHTYEPVDVPDRESVDKFLPDFEPAFYLDIEKPYTLNQLATPDVYMEMRYDMHLAMEDAKVKMVDIEDEYSRVFGRTYLPVEPFRCDDADTVFVTSGTITSTCRQLVNNLRKKGEKVGLLKIKMFRPFPVKEVCNCLGSIKQVAVIDRNFSFGAGGIFVQEVRAALYGTDHAPCVMGFICGLGGRDVTIDTLTEIYKKAKNRQADQTESVWIGLKKG